MPDSSDSNGWRPIETAPKGAAAMTRNIVEAPDPYLVIIADLYRRRQVIDQAIALICALREQRLFYLPPPPEPQR